jgi:cytochrome c
MTGGRWRARTARRLALPAALGLALAGCAAGTAAQSDAAPQGDNAGLVGSAARGKMLYEARCTACHSVDENRVGPMHRGVVGRMAGSVPGYDYSPALAQAHFIWTREKLMQWLKDPSALVPGTKMNYSVPEAQDRADLVAYLATLKK